jgi:hypothetical protein
MRSIPRDGGRWREMERREREEQREGGGEWNGGEKREECEGGG